MSEPRKPYLLLDVDGVLAVEPGDPPHPDLSRHRVVASSGQTHIIWLHRSHRDWLRHLADSFTLVWATGWGHDAPRLLEPLLGLPSMQVIEFTQRPAFGVPIDKLPDVIDFVGDSPVAWVDDELSQREQIWADNRLSPPLLIEPDPAIGLTAQHIGQLLRFARTVVSEQEEAN